MMLDFTIPQKIYLMTGTSRMTQKMEARERLIQASPAFNPAETAVYLFCNTDKNQLKLVYWDGEWFMTLSYHIKEGRLRWPGAPIQFIEISHPQLERLLRGDTIEPSVKGPKIKVN